MKPALVLAACVLVCIASADVLQNPSFEQLPSALAPNSTVPSVSLTENNIIPGWTSQGTVEYYLTGSAQGNQHAILLAADGMINQTFMANGDVKQYVLTFTLSLGPPPPGVLNCSANVSLVISAPDRDSEFFTRQHYRKEQQDTYGLLLGSWGNGESVNLLLHSQNTDTYSNSTCWPLVDNLVLKTLGLSSQTNDNMLPNGGFEQGPAFLNNSSGGVLLEQEPSLLVSALVDWSVVGTIRYIDSKSYFVPEGNAAVELASGDGGVAGVQTAKTLTHGSGYNLQFTLGDANDSCIGDLTVGVQAGSSVQNFTVQSRGTGSANKYSMTFHSESTPTIISFQSYATMQNGDGIFCGPVVDSVVLHASDGHTSDALNNYTFTALLATLLQLMFSLLV